MLGGITRRTHNHRYPEASTMERYALESCLQQLRLRDLCRGPMDTTEPLHGRLLCNAGHDSEAESYEAHDDRYRTFKLQQATGCRRRCLYGRVPRVLDPIR